MFIERLIMSQLSDQVDSLILDHADHSVVSQAGAYVRERVLDGVYDPVRDILLAWESHGRI